MGRNNGRIHCKDFGKKIRRKPSDFENIKK